MSQQRNQERADQIESAVLKELARVGTCTFSELVAALPDYTWNQVFMAVDQLSREERLRLKRQGQFDYLISTAPKNLPACNISLTRVSNE